MEKYLICIDLDSTFLKDNKSISFRARRYIRKLVRKGHYFIINTGRPHQGSLQFLKKLKINQPMIVNNGSVIIEYDKEYKRVTNYHTFENNKEILLDLYNEVKDYLNVVAVTSIFDFYTTSLEKCPFFIIHKDPTITFHEGDINSLLSTPPLRSEFFIKKEFIDEFMKIFSKEKYQKEFDYTAWGEWDGIFSFEIFPKGVSKGKAMEFLAEKLNINPKNTIAFGDQLNDISMLEFANDGVAIKNAREEVKSIANHITKKDNNHDGVISYLKEIL